MALSSEVPPAADQSPQYANTDLAQAFKDLAKYAHRIGLENAFPNDSIIDHDVRGEKAASVMESQLSTLERKIDDLLASVDEQTGEARTSSSPHPDGGEASQTGAGTKK